MMNTFVIHFELNSVYSIIGKVYAMCVERPTIDSTAYGETGENSNQIATNVEQRDC